MKANDFVALVLRSPLHGILGNTMLITVKGRRTGREISVPVNYYRDGDTLWIISTRSRQWWRNISPGSPVHLRLDGKEIRATADLVLDGGAIAERAADYVRRFPLSARFLGLRLERGVPNQGDIDRVARERVFVSVCTDETDPPWPN